MKLTARDALTDRVRRVSDEAHPITIFDPPGSVYAVFSEEQGTFLGLVTSKEIARHPRRIFGDLLGDFPSPVVSEDAPLDEIHHLLEEKDLGALPVMDCKGVFLGVVTRSRLLEVLLERSRHLSAELEVEQQRLRAWSSRLNELNQASRTLMGLMAHVEHEADLARNGLEVLATLIQARYGAVGILDETGHLVQFHHTGLTPEEAQRIPHPPEGMGLLGVVIRENQTLRLDDLSKDPRSAGFPPGHPVMKSLLAVPISDQGRVYGRVYLCDKDHDLPFSAEDEVLATTFAHNLALALIHAREQSRRLEAEEETAKLLSENRRLNQRLFTAQEEERRAIARELHDELGQCVTAAHADIETISRMSEGAHPNIYRTAQAAEQVLNHLYDVSHAMMDRLRPALLDELGLADALREAVAVFTAHHPGINCKLTLSGELDGLGETINITAYRIIQECLNNVAKHSGASEVEVRVCRRAEACRCESLFSPLANQLRLLVRDNGQGLVNKEPLKGLGLVGVRERVEALKGHFVMESKLGQGLCVAVEFPAGDGDG
jgi:signal transduction histidine kinase